MTTACYGIRMNASPRTQRSRAAAVSAALRAAGHPPMPSESTREGLLRVRSGLLRVTVSVDITLHPERINQRVIDDVREVLSGKGYLLEDTRRDECFARVYVRKPGW